MAVEEEEETRIWQCSESSLRQHSYRCLSLLSSALLFLIQLISRLHTLLYISRTNDCPLRVVCMLATTTLRQFTILAHILTIKKSDFEISLHDKKSMGINAPLFVDLSVSVISIQLWTFPKHTWFCCIWRAFMSLFHGDASIIVFATFWHLRANWRWLNAMLLLSSTYTRQVCSNFKGK